MKGTMITKPSTPPELAFDFALAVILSSDAPLLMLDGELRILAASRSFCRAFQIDPANVNHRTLAELGTGEWDIPQLDSLLKATASGFAEVEAYEMKLQRFDRPLRNLVVNAHKVDHPDARNVRLLLSVTDVTEARASERQKDTLVREKAILLQELQHRVANSLQIIASVLMQSARKIQSEESRAHLYDAHNRVMSVAVLQKQLATSTVDDVALRAYVTELCRTIGASMIRDRDLVSLRVNVDESVVKADISISFGLVVTELVINALKHAFPGNRSGLITVDYRSNGDGWTLSVTDDGVGMPTESERAKAGLGTSIVTALAAQVGAVIEVSNSSPGTRVALVHKSVTAIDGQATVAETAPV